MVDFVLASKGLTLGLIVLVSDEEEMSKDSSTTSQDETLKAFGSLVRQERELRGIEQKALAKQVELSQGMIWQVETGKVIPVRDTAEKIIRALIALGMDKSKKEPLLQAAEQGREAKKKAAQTKASDDKTDGRSSRREVKAKAFAEAISVLLFVHLDVSVPEFAEKIAQLKERRPPDTVRSWVKGFIPASAETLKDELIPALKELGASDTQIKRLKIAHTRDVLERAMNLPYWDDREQRHILQRLTNSLKNVVRNLGEDSYGES
jgi:transcriptional regulator with XRE-family HTH domain